MLVKVSRCDGADLVQGRRCQEWTREVVEVLVGKGVLEGSAIEVLDRVKAAEGTGSGSVSG